MNFTVIHRLDELEVRKCVEANVRLFDYLIEVNAGNLPEVKLMGFIEGTENDTGIRVYEHTRKRSAWDTWQDAVDDTALPTRPEVDEALLRMLSQRWQYLPA